MQKLKPIFLPACSIRVYLWETSLAPLFLEYIL